MTDIKKLKNIIKADPRYAADAYIFVIEALHYTQQKMRIEGHVTGRQLLEGIRDLAIERYGAMSKMVFEHWGIAKTIDFGNIVINLVNGSLLNKTSEDSIEDFVDVYDFDDVFVKGYRLNLDRDRNDPHPTK